MSQKNRRKNRIIALLSLSLLILAAGLAGCASEPRPKPAAPETVTHVSVIAVQRTSLPDWLEAPGTVQAAQTSQVSSQMTATITQMRAREGDRVQSQQVLAVLDDTQPRAAMQAATAAEAAAQNDVSGAESELTLAESTMKRYQQLYDKKSVSPQEFDEIKARYQRALARRDMARAGQQQANAELSRARASLGYAQIRAPFAGIVTERKADTGTLASPGMPLFTIEDTRSYRLEVTVDESDIGIVRLGGAAPAIPVTIDALGSAELRGKVVQIVPAADPASRSFLVKVQLPTDARLRSGLFGRARFSRGQRGALVIPDSSIVRRGQLQGVYVIDASQIAALRYVTLGKTSGQQTEVLAGLQEGERLIAAPGEREWGGKRVIVQP
ncbi:MAG: efflux RND transporter periplasmic adaptor subunit [Acidobacteriia bacterium]|nr:efflux RND transporter periplasmic adaptor subunit [Terriglobia bacterium]